MSNNRRVKLEGEKMRSLEGERLIGLNGWLVDIINSANAINPINFYPVKYFVEIELALLNLFSRLTGAKRI